MLELSGLERMFRMQEFAAFYKLQCSHVEVRARGSQMLEMCDAVQSGIERSFRMAEFIAFYKLQCSHVEARARGSQMLEMCSSRDRHLAVYQM